MLKDKLKTMRKLKQFTQDDVADFLGVKRQTYGAYERGISNPDANALNKLAEFFEVSTDYLLGTTNDPTSATNKVSNNSESFMIFSEELTKLDIDIEESKQLEILLNFIKDNKSTLKALMSVEEKAQVIDFNNIDTETVTVKKIARSKSNSLPSEMTLTKKQQDLLANAKPLSSEDDL